MDVLIVSDTHGQTDPLIKLRKQHPGLDYYIHCGDSELDKDHPAVEGYHVVRGNCDYGDDFPDEKIIEAGDKRIFVTHGHLYNVKYNLIKLKYKAEELNAAIVCFGHSHILGFEKLGGILFINPGSLVFPRSRKEKTYIILTIKDHHYVVNVYQYGTGLMFSEKIEENFS